MSTSTFVRGSSLRNAPFVQARPAGSRSALKVEANKRVPHKSKVIMTKDLENVGKVGEIKTVPTGFWRNYLLPRGLAKPASQGILDQIKKEQDDATRKKLEVKAQAKAFAQALSTIGKFSIKKKVGDKDQIFGSVQVSEIAEAIFQQTGRDVKDLEFEVPEIKSMGTYECRVKLHPEVNASFSVVIVKEKGAAAAKK